MTRVGIINVTGYAGSELARILHNHPEVELTSITGRSAAGKQLSEVFPHLRTASMEITPEIEGSVDLVFSALPHAASAETLKPFIDDGIPAVDISADFRLKDLATYESWYKVEHPCPNYIESAV
ncbi:MAG: N-acetyl-gamma-glutamyl-phosphate reductase, partial [Chloroflexi bacterium]|nr:N-acetyl-gamma-glutamyl-phosphate reductase [Chloroflexota bacterium]